jgi:NADH-quinone oxidoreductase subunit J
MDAVFAVAAGLGVGAGILVVTRRNPVYSALWMLVCFVALAVIYLRLDAPFLAAMHVLVYTGAILVLFLFVIMLLNLKPEEMGPEWPRAARLAAAGLCAGLFLLLAVPLSRCPGVLAPLGEAHAGHGSVEDVGRLLFDRYVLPFELVSVLILSAIFGGVLLAKKKL